MKISNWIKKLFKKNIVLENLFEQGAYHESGHIVMAYLSRYKSDEVTLIQTDPGGGFTKFDYGDQKMTLLIAAMQNFAQHPNIYHDLPSNIKAVSSQVAFKICGVLLGGPVSEALYKSGVDFVGNLPIEMSGPDLISVSNIHLFLSDSDPDHDPNYVLNLLTQVTNLLRQADCWRAIQHLSETILNSPNKRLDKYQIENSLNESGYMNFIK